MCSRCIVKQNKLYISEQFGAPPIGMRVVQEHWALTQASLPLHQKLVFVCLLGFYILATCQVISGWAQTRDSVRSWWFYNAAPVRATTTGTITRFLAQSHYPDTGLTSPWPILKMSRARLSWLIVAVLHPGNIYGQFVISADMWQYTFIVTLWWCPTGRPGHLMRYHRKLIPQ